MTSKNTLCLWYNGTAEELGTKYCRLGTFSDTL